MTMTMTMMNHRKVKIRVRAPGRHPRIKYMLSLKIKDGILWLQLVSVAHAPLF
jgi:hypothetical protein